MPQTFQSYMEDVLREAGYNDTEVTSALSKLYANDRVSAKLNTLAKTALEDYNAQVGRVRSLEERDRNRDREVTDYYARVNTEYGKVVKELTDLRRNGGGKGNDNHGENNGNNGNIPSSPDFDPNQFLTKEDWATQRQEMGNRFAGVLKDTNSIATAHALRFREPVDFDALERIAQEQKLPNIRLAYEKWIEPRVKEEEADSRKKWEADKRAEIERDVRSKNNLPIDPRPEESSPVYARGQKSAPKSVAEVDAELLATWHGTDKK